MTGGWTVAQSTATPSDTPSESNALAYPLDRLSTAVIALASLYVASYALGAVDTWVGGPLGTALDVVAGLFPLVLLVVGGLWFTQAGRNLDAMGVRQRLWWSGWGFLAWIVPLANLVLPYLYTRELWKASDPAAGRNDWQMTPVPAWLTVWWVLWAAQTVLPFGRALISYGYGRMVWLGQEPSFQIFTALKALNVVLLAASLVFFVHLVRALGERQRQKARRLPPATAFGAAEGPRPVP